MDPHVDSFHRGRRADGVIDLKIKTFLKDNWLAVATAALFVGFLFREPLRTGKAFLVGMKLFTSVLVIILTVFVFIGLFTVWVREEQIIRHFGTATGAKGLFLAALLGTLFHGPLPGILPILKSMREKGARLAVVVTVVSAFAIKLPMIPLEIQFLGIKFTVLHNLLILVTAPLVGLLMERLLSVTERR